MIFILKICINKKCLISSLNTYSFAFTVKENIRQAIYTKLLMQDARLSLDTLKQNKLLTQTIELTVKELGANMYAMLDEKVDTLVQNGHVQQMVGIQTGQLKKKGRNYVPANGNGSRQWSMPAMMQQQQGMGMGPPGMMGGGPSMMGMGMGPPGGMMGGPPQQ
jgi:hypothetical protein